VIDTLDFTQRQTLLRLLVEDVHVTGWHVQIRLRIPLDDGPDSRPPPPDPTTDPDQPGPMSTQDRLRSLDRDQGLHLLLRGAVRARPTHQAGHGSGLCRAGWRAHSVHRRSAAGDVPIVPR
jgi:hypothetical protein